MPIKEDRELTSALCDIEDGLTDWEVDFVEGIARQVHDEKRGLSPAQRKVAEALREEHCND